jgi:hypothetical protein
MLSSQRLDARQVPLRLIRGEAVTFTAAIKSPTEKIVEASERM